MYKRITKGILFTILIIALTKSGIAQAQETVTKPQSGAENMSTQEQAKQVANPLADIWYLVFQQNNNWVEMPFGRDSRVQSNLLFQPLIPIRLTEDWSWISRPVVTTFNSVPWVDPLTGQDKRTTGFGDTVLAMALAPTKNLVGPWIIALGPTFIFPTASDSKTLGQKEWQMGPVAAFGYQGKDYITYVLVQQWFSIGGWGKTTNQMATYYAYIHVWESGWTLGTQSQFTVDWKAPRSDRVTFPIGLQVGKMVKLGPLPVKIDVQGFYYPISPQVFGPNWGVQLQITPIIPNLIKGQLFGSSRASSTSTSAEVAGLKK